MRKNPTATLPKILAATLGITVTVSCLTSQANDSGADMSTESHEIKVLSATMREALIRAELLGNYETYQAQLVDLDRVALPEADQKGHLHRLKQLSLYFKRKPDTLASGNWETKPCRDFHLANQKSEAALIDSYRRHRDFKLSHDDEMASFYEIKAFESIRAMKGLAQIFRDEYEGGENVLGERQICEMDNRPKWQQYFDLRSKLITEIHEKKFSKQSSQQRFDQKTNIVRLEKRLQRRIKVGGYTVTFATLASAMPIIALVSKGLQGIALAAGLPASAQMGARLALVGGPGSFLGVSWGRSFLNQEDAVLLPLISFSEVQKAQTSLGQYLGHLNPDIQVVKIHLGNIEADHKITEGLRERLTTLNDLVEKNYGRRDLAQRHYLKKAEEIKEMIEGKMQKLEMGNIATDQMFD